MISKARLTRAKGTIQYFLEAKVASYKLYDNSLVSLIPQHGWLSDEVCKKEIYGSLVAHCCVTSLLLSKLV